MIRDLRTNVHLLCHWFYYREHSLKGSIKEIIMPSEQHVELTGSFRKAPPRSRKIGGVNPDEQVEITLLLNGPKLPTEEDFPRPAMSREEYREKYSISQKDIDTVTQELQRFGLTVQSVSPESRSMVVSGTLRQVQAAFPSNLGMYYHSDQGEYRGREGDIKIPSGLKDVVVGVVGLDKRQVVHRRSSRTKAISRKTATKPHQPTQEAVPGNGAALALSPSTPKTLEARYHFPPGQATGQNIVIAEFGGGYFASDLQAYCNKFGQTKLPKVNVQSLNHQPAYTLGEIRKLPPEQRNEQIQMSAEVMMDVEIIAGLCPEATITIYFSTFDEQGIVTMLNKIISAPDPLPVAVSVSWGWAEDDDRMWSASAVNAINERLNAVALLGITVCVSAGDDGSGDQIQDEKAHVDFPASSPFVLSVGGTMLKGGQEVVWWVAPGRRVQGQMSGATGGGASTIFDRPSWQKAIQARDTKGQEIASGRILPDVSALSASPDYDLIFLGKDMPNGGTSASAPLWASLLARIQEQRAKANKPPEFLTPLLYTPDANGNPRGASGCNDITSGNNVSDPDPGFGYAAEEGFDACSGWGTPDGQKLLNLLP